MNETISDRKARIKPYLEEYVERVAGPRTRNGMYVCPLCGSGTKNNKTPAFSLATDKAGTPFWKCFACEATGDIFTLYQAINNCDFMEALEALGNMYDTGSPAPAKKAPEAKPEAVDRTAYFAECMKARSQTDFFTKRGLTDPELLDRFKAGYDPHLKAAVLPTGSGTYFSKPVGGGKGLNQPKGEKQPLWNMEALHQREPVFVVEGILDALSVIQAGGEAVALLGTERRRLTDAVEAMQKRGEDLPLLVVMLDNDTAGEEGARGILEDLKALDIQAAAAVDLLPDKGQGAPLDAETLEAWGRYGELEQQRGKDPNDMLIEDAGAFRKLVAALKQAACLYGGKEAAEKAAADTEEFTRACAATGLDSFLDDMIDQGIAPIPTGFETLDAALDGGLYEGLYLIGAPSSAGKTTFMLQLADQVAATGQDVIYFTLEMSRKELMAKSISRFSKFAADEIHHPEYAKTARHIMTGSKLQATKKNYPEEYATLQSAVYRYSESAAHVYIIEGVANIKADKIREDIEKYLRLNPGRRPVVIIDYLQLVEAADVHMTDKQAVDDHVKKFKALAREKRIPVICISSFNRDSYRAGTPVANLQVKEQSFKESGGIEYTADVLIGLNQRFIETASSEKELTAGREADQDRKDAAEKAELQAVIIKNRMGARSSRIDLDFYRLFNLFEDKGPGKGPGKQSRPPKEGSKAPAKEGKKTGAARLQDEGPIDQEVLNNFFAQQRNAPEDPEGNPYPDEELPF